MKLYITTKSRLDGNHEEVVRFQHDDYANEDYAILTLAGFTKILEVAQGWATGNLETKYYGDVDELIADYNRNHSPKALEILKDEEAAASIAEKYQHWISEDIAADTEYRHAKAESTTPILKHNREGKIRPIRHHVKNVLENATAAEGEEE